MALTGCWRNKARRLFCELGDHRTVYDRLNLHITLTRIQIRLPTVNFLYNERNANESWQHQPAETFRADNSISNSAVSTSVCMGGASQLVADLGGYSWTGRTPATNSSTSPHFLGAIVLDQVLNQTGEIESRQVIDGQQRLTTLQLMLAAFRDLALSHNLKRSPSGLKS